jgi:hypothetical protein
MASTIENNAAVLTKELEWLRKIIDLRLRLYFRDEPKLESIFDIPAPALKSKTSTYASFVLGYELSISERIILILSLAPHIKPEILDAFFAKNITYDKRFSEFGGVSGSGPAFVPTGETALFLLAGEDLKERFLQYEYLDPEHLLAQNRVVKLEPVGAHELWLNGRLTLSEDYVGYFITGEFTRPEFSETFPARLITTQMEWEDAVYAPQTLEGITEIKDWIEYGDALLNELGLGKRLRPGFKSLFYGPPGTGKTLTASLLGKGTGRDVYKIDLSMIVSKYIGETEKNLARVFDQAETKDWILFFDEADALFGKRTEINNSHDRFANQEVAYLLQRIEEHKGVVILASNLKDNIDKAFTRRFQSIIHFPMPGAEERYNIWRQTFSEKLPPAKEVDLRKIAEKFTISGGLMTNVVRNCSLRAMKNKNKSIPLEDIENGIRRELQKEGIIFS